MLLYDAWALENRAQSYAPAKRFQQHRWRGPWHSSVSLLSMVPCWPMPTRGVREAWLSLLNSLKRMRTACGMTRLCEHARAQHILQGHVKEHQGTSEELCFAQRHDHGLNPVTQQQCFNAIQRLHILQSRFELEPSQHIEMAVVSLQRIGPACSAIKFPIMIQP